LTQMPAVMCIALTRQKPSRTLLADKGLTPSVREKLEALGKRVEEVRLLHRRIQPEE